MSEYEKGQISAYKEALKILNKNGGDIKIRMSLLNEILTIQYK